VVVSGVNIKARHTKPSQADPQGGIKRNEAPIHVSNVAHVDPTSGKPTRVGFKTDDKGRKVAASRSVPGSPSMADAKYTPRLKSLNDSTIREKMTKQFNYTNEMQMPASRQDRDQHGRGRSCR
jgi:ribosomal protein L24